MKNEMTIMKENMIEQSKDKEKFTNLENSKSVFTRLFRNNTAIGVAYDFKNKKLITPIRPIRAGLFKGSSDCIGWESIIVTPNMVGKRIAIFKAVEMKTLKGKATKEQENFIRIVNLFGGIAYFHTQEKKK